MGGKLPKRHYSSLLKISGTDISQYPKIIDRLRKEALKMPDLENVLPLTVATTGRRISEILALEVRHIDIDNSTITFKCLKKREPTETTIKVPSYLITVLSRYIVANGIGGKLFKVSRNLAYYIVKKKTGYNPHAFRHLIALYLMLNGYTLEETRRYLCHSNYNMVLRYASKVGLDFQYKPNPLEGI